MADIACPNCGAPVSFRSAALPASVCAFCQSTVVRQGAAYALAGKAAAVPQDVSPVQIGMRGRDGPDPFEVIGRVRWRWTDGAWSEWLILFADGGYGWLSEAAARFMLLRQTEAPAAAADLLARVAAGTDIIGARLTIGDVDYEVNDARPVTCIGSEGELPFVAMAGETMLSVDLLRDDGRCGSVQREGDAVAAYAGRYVALAELRPTGMREIEGWPMPDFMREAAA